MEETELEEGEACYFKDDASIDPDITLSYIDEKLQHVLGHFQKDFEGGVSAENLGAKFGGYGSFLPTYQRSPSVRSQPKTPLRAQNYSTPRSPNNLVSEGAPQNSTVPEDFTQSFRPAPASHSTRLLHDPKVASSDASTRKDSCLLPVQVGEEFSLKDDPSGGKLVNPTKQRSLKVRIRVGNNRARKNAAIYSGLGLASPSSSNGNSPEESGGMPTESQETLYKSPGSILHDMTSFPIPGNQLLSPLHERLLCLIRKEKVSSEKKLVLPIKGRHKSSSKFVDESSSMLGDEKLLKENKTRSVDKSEAPEELKYGNCIDFQDNTTPLSEKRKETETLESKQCHTTNLKIKLSSNSIRDAVDSLNGAVMAPEVHRETKKDVPVKKREMRKDWVKDRVFPTDLGSKESLESISGLDYGKPVKKETKSSSMEHVEEYQVRGPSRKILVDRREGVRIKGSRVSSVSKADSDVSKHDKDSIAVSMDHLEKKASSKATTHELHIKMPHGLELEKKSKSSQSNGRPASNLVEENLRPGVWSGMKDKKSAQNDVCKVHGSYKGVLDTRFDYMDNQMKSLERSTGNRAKGHDLEAVRRKEVSLDGLSTEALPPQIELAPGAPTAGNDSWVCCDLCEKWRLLPNGVEPDQFPGKWLCSMLYWLPGMNHCDINEDATTAAVRALHQNPVPQVQDNLQNHADIAISGVTSADFGHLNNNENFNFDPMPNQKKKKSKSKPSGSSSVPIQTSHLTIDSLEDALKGKTCNFPVERQVPKLNGKLVNGGDVKYKKLKSKRESDEYEHRSSKKIRIDATPDIDKYWKSEHAGDHGPTMASGKDMDKHSEQWYSAKGNPPPNDKLMSSVTRQRDSTKVSLKCGALDRNNCDERELHVKKRKLKDWQQSQPYVGSLGGNENHFPENKIREESGNRKLRKEKKFRMSNSELKDSSADDRPVNKGIVTKIFFLASRDNSVDRSREKDKKPSRHTEEVASQPTLDDAYSSRKDLGLERFSLAATSSSSKVSDSRRRVSLQEIRGSPVESVSSSPMRALKPDKLSPPRRGVSRKDGAKNGDFVTGSPRKSFDRKANFESNRSGRAKNGEASGPMQDFRDSDASHRFGGKVESSKIRNSHLANHDADTIMGQRQGRTDMQSSDHGDSEGRLSMKHDSNVAKFPKKSGKGSPSRSKDKERSSSFQRVKVKLSDPLIERGLIPKKMQRVQVDCYEPASHPEELTEGRKKFSIECSTKSNNDDEGVGKKGSGRWASDSREENPTKLTEHDGLQVKLGDIGSAEGRITLKKDFIKEFESDIPKKRDPDHIESRGGKSGVNPHHSSKVDELALVCQPLSRSQEGNGFGVHPFDGSGDRNLSKVLKQSGNALHQNGAHNTVKNLVPTHCTVKDLNVSSFVKETSSQTATNALKQAEKFRGDANRFKDSGFHYECNEANFQAALQFLYSASLLEACSSECTKQGEMNPVQIYSTAAKLSQNCALEYEKRKEMAAAALTYKCMEVAYMKVVYCQSSSTNRDRHDLQASLQMVTQGESPSSSASDVDNLNNQATMDKAALSKGIAHAGNHVIVARSRPNFVRLLDFTNAVSSAMEASRKSQSAYTAAKVTLEEAQNKEGIISVKKVIDFSFHDVEELVRLVKHAIEVISRQGFSGK